MAPARPFVLLSVATSIDGHIDDTTADRLLLSNADDFDRVDQVRADSDAILVGGNTLRRDNPRLLVNSDKRRAERVAAGKPEFPLKVTISASGDLSRDLKFWHHGDKKVVYTTDEAAPKLRETLNGLADVVSTGTAVDFGAMLDDLAQRGVERLMVEGGGQIHTQFLSQGLADEIHLAIAPLLVGDAAAPRFVHPAEFPGGSTHRMKLIEARPVGDVVLLRYAPKESVS
ncbi:MULTISPECIES: dihydrofolate reductase family protein [unclassified Kitasatospora]|uniref:RibD family protein n=1 Tax=unclassified Kitasatospora TaxID=2633591 RepID=UPI000710311D|nr:MULTISPECIES: dihydrofolate reductase family protein [unclassified Kitasatospora]KQV20850.1 deaminase [Kitasatospora sp. Root107]KRB60495.1 deaminase [Kitasatospora sp. Root187]